MNDCPIHSAKAQIPPTCTCGEPACSGVNDGGNHQCGGPSEACAIPGCPECGTPAEETGWLIECVTLGKIAYWCGPQLWTGDHLEAVRFARREDAERVWLHPSCQGIEAHVTEHIWSHVKLRGRERNNP